jgi:hypothetical protein
MGGSIPRLCEGQCIASNKRKTVLYQKGHSEEMAMIWQEVQSQKESVTGDLQGKWLRLGEKQFLVCLSPNRPSATTHHHTTVDSTT